MTFVFGSMNRSRENFTSAAVTCFPSRTWPFGRRCTVHVLRFSTPTTVSKAGDDLGGAARVGPRQGREISAWTRISPLFEGATGSGCRPRSYGRRPGCLPDWPDRRIPRVRQLDFRSRWAPRRLSTRPLRPGLRAKESPTSRVSSLAATSSEASRPSRLPAWPASSGRQPRVVETAHFMESGVSTRREYFIFDRKVNPCVPVNTGNEHDLITDHLSDLRATVATP